MKANRTPLLLSGMTALLLQACASQPALPPSWVLNPTGDGIVATGCSSWSGSINIDRQAAIANARTALAQQIEISIDAVDRVIARKTGDAVVENSFESISEQRTDQILQSARARRVEVVEFENKEQLCAMVELGESNSRMLFDQVMENSTADFSPEDEADMYSMFIAAS